MAAAEQKPSAKLAAIVLEVLDASVTDFESVVEIVHRRAVAEDLWWSLTALAIHDLSRMTHAGLLAADDGRSLTAFGWDMDAFEQDNESLHYAIGGRRCP